MSLLYEERGKKKEREKKKGRKKRKKEETRVGKKFEERTWRRSFAMIRRTLLSGIKGGRNEGGKETKRE